MRNGRSEKRIMVKDLVAKAKRVWEDGLRIIREKDGEKFLFLGPRASGKTVFFVCAARMLQYRLGQRKKARFSEADETSRAYLHASLEKMRIGKWPDKTQFGHEISCETVVPRRPIPFLPPAYDEQMVLSCVDYPGDAWTYAFHRRGDDAAIGQYADELKEHVVRADGIFLLLDSVVLHDIIYNSRRENDEWDHFSASLFGMAKELAAISRERRLRLAIVFCKRDRFDGVPFDPEAAFRRVAPGAYDNLRQLDSRCFFVSSVGRTITDARGEPVPPVGFCPEYDENPSLLEPLVWMLRLRPEDV